MTIQDHERIRKMHRFAKDATEIAKDITLERLSEDKAYQYSLLYPMGQIGEIAINIGDDIIEQYSSIEWADWRGFRNRLFHDYGALDFAIVYEMITEALPLLLSELGEIINEI